MRDNKITHRYRRLKDHTYSNYSILNNELSPSDTNISIKCWLGVAVTKSASMFYCLGCISLVKCLSSFDKRC